MENLSSLRDDAELEGAQKILSWLFLLSMILLTGVAKGIYASQGLAPSLRFEFLSVLGTFIFFWFWIRKECEPCGATFPMDFGWFVGIAGPVVALYYLWRYQRWRGLAKLAALVLAYVASLVVGGVTRVLLS
jgi:hypothetical protein